MTIPKRDETLLISCVAYQEGNTLADIDVEDSSTYLDRPGCFVWGTLCDASEAELTKMQIEFGQHDSAIEVARHGNQRPKVEEYGDTLFMVVDTIEANALQELQVGEVDEFVGRNLVLSVRNHSQESLLDVRDGAEHEPHLLRHGAGFVLYGLMDTVEDHYFPVIDALESDLEGIARQNFARGSARANIEQLYGLKHRMMTIKHAVKPMMESGAKLWSGRVPAVCEDSHAYFRDVYDHLTRMNAALDILREAIGTGIQVNLSMVKIEESQTTKRLAAWAGIFAVATAFSGIWRMNLEYMPELKLQYGYPAALALIAAGLLLAVLALPGSRMVVTRAGNDRHTT